MTVAVLGEALVDLILGDDGAYRPHLGGSPYNVAIGLARQGIDVSYLSALSDDKFGDCFYESLASENVRVPLERRSRWPTSLALVTLDDKGHASYRLYREGIADKDTSFEEVVANLPVDLRIFHTGSLAITPSQLPKIRRVFDVMRERDVLVSVDINIRLGASIDSKKYLDGVRSLVQSADIVKASDEDIAAFELNADIRKSAEIIYDEMGEGLLVLTEGTGGAVAFGEQGTVSRPAYPVESLVDTVGAGDTFHAALLSTLYRNNAFAGSTAGISLETLGVALDYASAAAAINVSRAGCSPPSAQETADFIAKTGTG